MDDFQQIDVKITQMSMCVYIRIYANIFACLFLYVVSLILFSERGCEQ